jgi:hypothetical protein
LAVGSTDMEQGRIPDSELGERRKEREKKKKEQE